MSVWDNQEFEKATERLSSVEEIGDFIRSLPETTQLERVYYCYWRQGAPTASPSIEFANYDLPFGSKTKVTFEAGRAALYRLAFERLLPVNLFDEIQAGTELGNVLSLTSLNNMWPSGLAIVVRAPSASGGLLLADFIGEPDERRRRVVSAQGEIQLFAQRLHLAIERVSGSVPEILSARERDCLRLIAEGRTVKSIARELRLSDQTVTFYLSRARMKLHATNTTEAVVKSLRAGLLDQN